jgi:hypothetical protein
MKIKQFYLNIGNDQIPFTSIPLKNDNSIEEGWEIKDYAFSNNPEILNTTHLNYIPFKYSTWNGTEFIAPEGETHKIQTCQNEEKCKDGCVTFAFLINNVSHNVIAFCVNELDNDMIIAALSSNPTISFEIIDV